MCIYGANSTWREYNRWERGIGNNHGHLKKTNYTHVHVQHTGNNKSSYLCLSLFPPVTAFLASSAHLFSPTLRLLSVSDWSPPSLPLRVRKAVFTNLFQPSTSCGKISREAGSRNCSVKWHTCKTNVFFMCTCTCTSPSYSIQYPSDTRYKANTFVFSCKRVCLLV